MLHTDLACNMLEYLFTAMLTETSSIFLSIRSLIRTYLRLNSDTDTNTDTNTNTILKQFQNVNEMVFFGLFCYTRIYIYNKEIIFNPEFYLNISKYFNFYMLDKIIVFCVLLLSAVNMYWFGILANKIMIKFFDYDIFKYKPNPNDTFLKQIEEIHAILNKDK